MGKLGLFDYQETYTLLDKLQTEKPYFFLSFPTKNHLVFIKPLILLTRDKIVLNLAQIGFIMVLQTKESI